MRHRITFFSEYGPPFPKLVATCDLTVTADAPKLLRSVTPGGIRVARPTKSDRCRFPN